MVGREGREARKRNEGLRGDFVSNSSPPLSSSSTRLRFQHSASPPTRLQETMQPPPPPSPTPSEIEEARFLYRSMRVSSRSPSLNGSDSASSSASSGESSEAFVVS